MKKQFAKSYKEIIGLENLFAAWHEFVRGKKSKKDVQEFSLHLADNILQLHEELANFSYRHCGYQAFNISDPKPRLIHKAIVRDRILHHAICRQLYPFFDTTFIADSYSCRLNKGTHKAIDRFNAFAGRVSKNHHRTAWVLKCDIRKFFASINQARLLEILNIYIIDKNILRLLEIVIASFHSRIAGQGLPLGNLTSQLFCNVYMNEFDQFVKHKLKAKYYIRYADDFVFLSENKSELENMLVSINEFLGQDLELTMHPGKVFISTFASGVDFLGWVNFSEHKILRTKTKKRMFIRIHKQPTNETLQSYLGLMRHGNTYNIQLETKNWYGLWHKN